MAQPTDPYSSASASLAGALTHNTGSRVLAKLKPLLTPLAVLGLAGSIVFVSSGRWTTWVSERSAQTTDDAQLRADVTPLSTKGAGIVAEVAVTDFQRVKAGDLLIKLQDDDFRAQVELAEAAVVSAQAALDSLASQRALQNSKIVQARANVSVTKPDLERSSHELDRERVLERADASTKQRLELAEAEHARFEATLVSRQAELDTQRKQITVLDAQEAQLKADLMAKQAALKLAKVNLEYTSIVAPTAGIVGERKVRPGQLVSAGTQVISLVGDALWVVANYKESQLAHVKVGNRADLTVDGVPGAHWSGHVETISPASGAMFALLPPDNATGNFTKIMQRIPLKITLDPLKGFDERLRAGMSVVAVVRTDGE